MSTDMPFDVQDIFQIDELPNTSVSDEQAMAVDRLAFCFNMLESCVAYAIAFVIDPNQMAEIDVVTERMSFVEKLERLERLTDLIEADIRKPPIWHEFTGVMREWAERDFANKRELVRRLKAANKFRNRLIHCQATRPKAVTCPPKTLPAIIEDSPAKRRRGVLKREKDAA